MNPDTLARLLAIARGETPPLEPAGRNERKELTPEAPAITPLRRLRPENDERQSTILTAGAPAEQAPPDDEAAIEERRGRAADRVPRVYLDAWARLNHQKPEGVSESEWRGALDDGGQFLDAWGSKAAEAGWTPGELFDAKAGLVWRLAGERIEAIGADRVPLCNGRTLAALPTALPIGMRPLILSA
jgi:hypothetical protein